MNNFFNKSLKWVGGTMLTILFLALLSSCKSDNSEILEVNDLRCEYRINPLGIDNTAPRLSWKLVDQHQKRGQKQSAFQILVASSLDNLNNNIGDLWDSGKTETNASVNNVYAGKKLASNQACFWKVKVWDAANKESNWSDSGKFSMGLLKSEDWKGDWIYKADQKKIDHNWYRKTFTLSENATSAFVHVGSFGYHELYVNGEKVTDNVLNPVASYMKKRIPYLTYDIADKLKKGNNVIAVWHAAGWARWTRIREYRMVPFVFKAQAEIVAGGENITLKTDETWKTKKSNSEYYGDWDILRFGGETIDDSKREDDWNTAQYNDSNWMNASVYDYEVLNAKIPEGNNISFALNSNKNREVRALYSPIKAELSAQMVEPQVKFKKIKAIGVAKNDDGTYRIDLGENYTGFFEMDLYNGKEGDSILFEISDQTERIMNWSQKSKYIFGKSGKGKFSNRFNVAGGRWVTVYGLKYEPKIADARGYVVTNNRKQISKFESSSAQLNQIYQVNLNTYLANTMDGILVDCPHRERRGWGEVTVAAMYGDALPNFESGAYMDQYLQYTRDAQFLDGQTRAVLNEEDRPFLMWKANNPLTVWETYRMLGDKKVLEDNYESMQKWMTWLYEHSNYKTGGALIIGEQGKREMPGLGDWCTPRGNFWTSSNSPDAAHFNNCLYAFMLENAMHISEALNKTEDALAYKNRLKVQQEATHKLSYNPETGKYLKGYQVDQAFALLSGVTPASEKEKAEAQLVNNVLYDFPYYDTGSSGQALYTRYFTESGERMDLIYELLRDKHHPSYGYFIEQGKTVWPERWSAVGNSQIHTCYTGIGGYFIKGFGGIRPNPESLGMQNMIIKPAPVGDLTYANTAYESMYGNVVVNWTKKANTATFHIEVPVNTTAKVYLPATDKNSITEGGALAENSEYISYVGTEKNDAVGNYVIYNVTSGIYDFNVTDVPETSYPEPLNNLTNFALIGRMSASSMFIETEKLPGFEAFKANDEDDETRWLSAETKNQYLEVAWVKPQTFNQIMINEFDNQITNYKILYWENDKWKDLVSYTTCGANKTHKFDAVTATKCRIYIIDAKKAPSISEIKIYQSN
ncbi:Bacterial alpha-L-rhamnosidase [Algibacter amylolyticus]|uniref:alpha-L-rhamnosidase n=1 Tax=Algibacter amylolyticus TaxID=1608400 RepID=A0A5M7B5N6_9FLAO|nr:family 78 glycoside hydrolase catalytic domain [Algibacter amylolyticus]KAA5824843.1 Bacterial alpha-L-rhamnosidase [Algibacter amylolyticus]MBB5268969.1 alpha-L-rhamnosidase [Algibacter amylolyticus]TSJ76008.1 Bacterial alpha-L-rhamnosidase [Algibacter amylolyticus]